MRPVSSAIRALVSPTGDSEGERLQTRTGLNQPEVGGLNPSPATEIDEHGPRSDGYRAFKPFQIRWKEPLGNKQCPYLYRWMIVLFGYSIRLHHWIKSDDRRYFHDHGCDFLSIVLKGSYTNVTPSGQTVVRAGSFWFSKADQLHYLDVPATGAWTLLFCGRKYRKWGFYVAGRLMRPWNYFKRFGVIQDENYQ